MSAPGQPMSVKDHLANALAAQQGGPTSGAAAPAPGGGAGGSFQDFMAAFQRCEQTKQCSPQDRAILEAGLPKLVQMAQMVQQILAATAGQGGGNPPPPASGQQPQQ